MKKILLVTLTASFLLAGCFNEGEQPVSEPKLEKKLEKTVDKITKEEMIENETGFGTEEIEVIVLKEEITEVEKEMITEYTETMKDYATVATDVEQFHSYMLVLAEIHNRFPELLTIDEWQGLQEQWQELNDPID